MAEPDTDDSEVQMDWLFPDEDITEAELLALDAMEEGS